MTSECLRTWKVSHTLKSPVSQMKKSKCLGLAKRNASLVFWQSLALTIHHPLIFSVNTSNMVYRLTGVLSHINEVQMRVSLCNKFFFIFVIIFGKKLGAIIPILFIWHALMFLPWFHGGFRLKEGCLVGCKCLIDDIQYVKNSCLPTHSSCLLSDWHRRQASMRKGSIGSTCKYNIWCYPWQIKLD